MTQANTITADANGIQTLLRAGQVPQVTQVSLDAFSEGAIPVLLTPEGMQHKLLTELETRLPQPLRKKGQVSLDDADSFIKYVKEHGSLATCTIWLAANYAQGLVKFTAIVNDNSGQEANWRDFTAEFLPVKSEEWKRWAAQDGKAMSQAEFATFIEDNMGDIATVEGMPTGSQIMEMALTFEATSEKRFKSAQRIQSGGISLEYVDQEDSATQARMSMFDRFSLGVAPFFNGTAYRLDARLRYRIREGKLTLWYELVRPDRVLQDATEALIQKVKDEAGFPLYFGQPFKN